MSKRFVVLLLSAFALISCSRDPQVVKKRFLESGNKYYDRGKYKEASIMYRRALATDAKYGEGWYRLGLTYSQTASIPNAVSAYRRAAELLPKNSKEYDDSNFRMAEIFLLAASSPNNAKSAEQMIGEVQAISKQFLDKDANSFEGHKLKADLIMINAVNLLRATKTPEAKVQMEQAIAEYRKTLDMRPGSSPLQLALARTLALYGESSEAEQLYRKLIDKKEPNSPAYIELYRLYAGMHKLDDAEGVLKQAIQANPKNFDYEVILGAHYFANGKRDEGVKVLENMKANFKDFPRAYFTAGDFYLRLNDGPSAIKQYEEGERKDAAHKVDYQKRVIEAYQHDNKTALAYEENLKILKDNPKDPEARGLKASFLLDKGDVAQAINELQSVVTARPDNFVARFHLGRAHFAKGEYEQARQQFEKSLELKTDYVPPRVALAQVALARGDSATALKISEDVLRQNPESGAGRLLQAAALMRLNRYGDSRTTLNTLLTASPKQPETLLEVGVLDLMEKKYDDAAASFRRAYDADPTNARGLLGQAEAYLQMNKPAEALKTIADEAAKYPKRMDLKRDLADMENRTGHPDMAINDYKALIESVKDSPRQQGEIYARIGETYSRLKDYPKAIDALKRAKELIPDSTIVLNNLALLLDNSGQHLEARKVYEQSIAHDQTNAAALNNLAYLMSETGGNLDEALTLAQRAKQAMPTQSEISDTIGWIYLKKNLPDNAVDIFRDITTKVPTNSTYHYHLAMALVQKGDKNEAAKQCQLALSNKPNKEEEGRIRELMTRI